MFIPAMFVFLTELYMPFSEPRNIVNKLKIFYGASG